MTNKLRFNLSIPVEIDMDTLSMADQANFVERCMFTPANCDNDLSEEENREWFAQMWKAQVSLQQHFLENKDHLTLFLKHLVLDEMGSPSHSLKALLNEATPLEIGDAIKPAAQALGEIAHFYPPLSYGLDTTDMVLEIKQALAVKIKQPTIQDLVIE